MRRSPSGLRPAAAAVGLSLLPGLSAGAPPSDSDRAAARALFDQGRELMAAGRLTEACPKLAESLRLVPGMGTRFNLAECYERSGRLASAWINYLDVATEARDARRSDQEKVARERAAALKPRLATLKIEVVHTSPWLTLERNGVPIPSAQWDTPLPVDLGQHTVVASTSDGQRREYTVRIDREGQAESIRVEIRADDTASPSWGAPVATATSSKPAAPPSAPDDVGASNTTVTAGWVVTVLGGMTAAAGGVVFGLGLGKIASAEDACPTRVGCSVASTDEGNEGRTMRDAGVALLAGGGAVLLSGLIVLAVGYSAEPDPGARASAVWWGPVVGQGQAGLDLGLRW